MSLLITGGAGFVMSNLARHWLESDPAAEVLVLDMLWDEAVERFFAPVRDRLRVVRADVSDPTVWESFDGRALTHIVHGATITPSGERERADPRRILEVNMLGTVNALEFARRLPALKRFIYVSSGAVYGEPLPGTPDGLVREAGRVDPIELYGITKFASEALTRRYGELFGCDVAIVRFSGVYGPMDRHTGAREVDCVPKKIVFAALAGHPIKVKALEAGGDFIHAGDIAVALTAMLRAPRLKHAVYNVAQGEFTLIAQLIEMVREVLPGLQVEVVPEAEADIIYDPRNRLARWGAYDISRLREELGWTPRPVREALQSYFAWARDNG
ncbi:MAG: NAD-dependent epimerase/dehydratase family protein [Anaerolineales bacterium]